MPGNRPRASLPGPLTCACYFGRVAVFSGVTASAEQETAGQRAAATGRGRAGPESAEVASGPESPGVETPGRAPAARPGNAFARASRSAWSFPRSLSAPPTWLRRHLPQVTGDILPGVGGTVFISSSSCLLRRRTPQPPPRLTQGYSPSQRRGHLLLVTRAHLPSQEALDVREDPLGPWASLPGPGQPGEPLPLLPAPLQPPSFLAPTPAPIRPEPSGGRAPARGLQDSSTGPPPASLPKVSGAWACPVPPSQGPALPPATQGPSRPVSSNLLPDPRSAWGLQTGPRSFPPRRSQVPCILLSA
ncbi:uncharacterized protein LOC120889572 [Ictidomys tridecemlineatus]